MLLKDIVTNCLDAYKARKVLSSDSFFIRHFGHLLVPQPYGSGMMVSSDEDFPGIFMVKPSMEGCNPKIIDLIYKSGRRQRFSNKAYTTYNVYHPNCEDLEGLTILHISDTHFRDSGTNQKKLSGLGFTREEYYDLILFTGDIVDNDYHYLNNRTVTFLKAMQARIGKFFVFGNHDYESGGTGEIERQFGIAGFENMSNRRLKLSYNGNPFNLIGFDDIPAADLTVIREEDSASFNIVMLHNLDGLFCGVFPWADLALSGHLHSGEIRIPGLMDGVDHLMGLWAFLDVNRHKTGFKFLTPRTLSYISPGLDSRYFRLFTEPETITKLTLKAVNPSYVSDSYTMDYIPSSLM